jgi:hypothetical protein
VQVLCNYNLCDKSSYKTPQFKVLLSEQTLKQPSDNSDNIGALETLKHPSDNSDNIGAIETLKHPCDNSDNIGAIVAA